MVLVTGQEIRLPPGYRISRPPPGNGHPGQKIPEISKDRSLAGAGGVSNLVREAKPLGTVVKPVATGSDDKG